MKRFTAAAATLIAGKRGRAMNVAKAPHRLAHSDIRKPNASPESHLADASFCFRGIDNTRGHNPKVDQEQTSTMIDFVTYPVSAEDLAAFQRDGAVCLRNVVPKEDVARLREASIAFMNEGRGRTRDGSTDMNAKGRFFSAAFLGAIDKRFNDFAANSVLPEVAAQLMETDQVRFYYDQLFIKEPGATSPTAWHNDLPYWPLLGEDILSLWVALTPVSRETSGVQYLAGSHRWNTMFRAITPDNDPKFMDYDLEPCPNYSDPEISRDHEVLSWDLQPGDVLAHHPLTAHGAGGNASASAIRIGLSIRYLGRDVRWSPRPFVMKLPIEPQVAPGQFPADDLAFPIVGSGAG